MISGGIQADCGLLVISAGKGEFEAGVSSGGMTKEHLLVMKASGIEMVGVVVNKMDDCGWSKQRFDEIRTGMVPYLKYLGYSKNQVK